MPWRIGVALRALSFVLLVAMSLFVWRTAADWPSALIFLLATWTVFLIGAVRFGFVLRRLRRRP